MSQALKYSIIAVLGVLGFMAFCMGMSMANDARSAYLAKTSIMGTAILGGYMAQTGFLTPGEIQKCNVELGAADKLFNTDAEAANEHTWACGQLLMKASERTEPVQQS